MNAKNIRKTYGNKPLVIKVSLIGALLTGKLELIFGSRRTWDPNNGLKVIAAKGGKNIEALTVSQLLNYPDIDYISIVDWVRSTTMLCNTLLRLVGLPELSLWDGPGDLLFKAPSGNERLLLELARHPKELADFIKEVSNAINQDNLKSDGRNDDSEN